MIKKVLLATCVVIAPVLFFSGCEQSQTRPAEYGDSLNLWKVKEWVRNDVHINDKKILEESKKFFMRVVSVVVRNKQQGVFSGIKKEGDEYGFSSERVKSNILLIIAIETTGGLHDPAFDPLYYEVYETIMRKKKLDMDVLLFRFYTEGFGMRPDDYAALKKRGYFRGIEKLAQSSRAY